MERSDFFVSHSPADRGWALWIAGELERAGATTTSQALDFRPGHDLVRVLRRAAHRADCTIVVSSATYFGLRLGEVEWRAVFAPGPSGSQSRVLAVRVADCDLPEVLSTPVHVDLIGVDEDTARARLLRGVDLTEPGSTATRRPAPPAAAHRPGWSAARFPGTGPAISNLPPRNPAFTGRDALLERLHARLQEAPTAAVLPVEAAHGSGGVGKTELVIEYAHRYRGDYDLVWWIPAERPAAAAAALVALARRLDIPDTADQDAALASLFDRLRCRERWLLVYDNAEQPSTLAGLLPPDGGGAVVVTSRWAAWRQRARPVRVGVFDRGESVQFLARRTRVGTDLAPTAGLERVAELVGDLPLALDEAAGYVAQTGIDLDPYLDLLTTRARDLFGLDPVTTAVGGGTDTQRVATVSAVSLDRVRVDAPAAEALLRLCAFLGPDIPRSLLSGHLDALPAALADPEVFDTAIAVLGRYGLVESNRDTIVLHRLLQAVLRARLRAERRDARQATTAVELVRAAFPDAVWEQAQWPECERLLPQLLAVCEHAERLTVAGEPAGWLLDRASTYLRARGLVTQARPVAERALALTATALGPHHVETGWRHDELGHVLEDLGDLTGARTHLERALQISESALGADHLDIGARHGELGSLLHDLGDLDTARTHLECAVRISESALGPDHPDVGTRHGNLGTVLHDLGDLDAARTHLERALQISEDTVGPEHSHAGVWRNNLGTVLRDSGDLAAARAQLELALRISENALGPDDAQSRAIRANLDDLAEACRPDTPPPATSTGSAGR